MMKTKMKTKKKKKKMMMMMMMRNAREKCSQQVGEAGAKGGRRLARLRKRRRKKTITRRSAERDCKAERNYNRIGKVPCSPVEEFHVLSLSTQRADGTDVRKLNLRRITRQVRAPET